ncbi:UNKNOWN [Stylonychia lemnae]|uniref:Uncharacterized protein n=1 Tax=Stylonychia lemnae TaxID=5949 RepID=A0A078ART2_STYLE|nr:UNKNOWN [Stylonychia lemnae]|eukprot:CDW85195.1 UNKNOWN [Stylonychia lemnae]
MEGSNSQNLNMYLNSNQNQTQEQQNLKQQQLSHKKNASKRQNYMQEESPNQVVEGLNGFISGIDFEDIVKGLSNDDMLTSKDYLKEMQRMFGNQSLFGLKGDVSKINQQRAELINLESPNDEKSNQQHQRDSKHRQEYEDYKRPEDSQITQFDAVDSSKKSTSPPSNSNRSSLRTGKDRESQLQNIINSNIKQQQFIQQLQTTLALNQKVDTTLLGQLQLLVQQQNDTLQTFNKTLQNLLHENDIYHKQENEQSFQKLKVKAEIENDPLLKQDILTHFGSTQKFLQSIKFDQVQIIEYIRVKIQKSSNLQVQNQKNIRNEESDNKNILLRRKGSDPKFDNEEYLKMIEEKYMHQLEQSLMQDSIMTPSSIDLNSVRQSNDVTANNFIQNQTKNQNQRPSNKSIMEEQKKKKRIHSEDKFDKKEFQERMETQFLNMIKKQFPVDDSDDDTIKQNELNSPQVIDETLVLKQAIEKMQIPSILLTNQVMNNNKSQGAATNKNIQNSEQKNLRSKHLQIDMPDDMANMLSDSKDMLEDPQNSNINFFELDNVDSDGLEAIKSYREEQKLLHLSSNKDKKKKANMGNAANSMGGINGLSPDMFKNTDKNTTLDNWKQEVKKVFQKKKPTNNSKSPSIITVQSNMSPQFKQSKSPTSTVTQRNPRLDIFGNQNLSMKDKISKSTAQGIQGEATQSTSQYGQITSFLSYNQNPNGKPKTSRSPNNQTKSKLNTKSKEESKRSINPQVSEVAKLMINPINSSRNQKSGQLQKLMSYQQQNHSQSDLNFPRQINNDLIIVNNSVKDQLSGTVTNTNINYLIENRSQDNYGGSYSHIQSASKIQSAGTISSSNNRNQVGKSRNQINSKSPSLR